MQFNGLALALFTLLALLLFVLKTRFVNREKPYLAVSVLDDFKVESPSWKTRWASLPSYLVVASFFLFGLAFIDPHRWLEDSEGTSEDPRVDRVQPPREGVALYLLLDRSSSMQQPLQVRTDMGWEKMSRLDYLKLVTEQFIRGRPNDLLGLIGFARVAYVAAPLTFDHDYLIEQTKKLEVVSERNEDGTAIGYALLKAANLVATTRHYAQEVGQENEAAYQIRDTALILVTDGLQMVHPLDQKHERRATSILTAAGYAKEQGVRVYIVNIEPAISRPEYRQQMEELVNAAEVTGGLFFLASEKRGLGQIFQEIEKMEASLLPDSRTVMAQVEDTLSVDGNENRVKVSYAPFFVVVALTSLIAALFGEQTLLRRWP